MHRRAPAWSLSLLFLPLAALATPRRSAPAEAPADLRGSLVLNEVLVSNTRTSLDEDGRTSDWVEVLNRSRKEVDLTGFGLSDDPSRPGKWTFPRAAIPAGGYLVVWASGKDRHVLPPRTLDRMSADISFERSFIRAGDEWRYLLADPLEKGPPAGWTDLSFDDDSFATGPSGFGYADGDDATQLPEGANAVFLRGKFTVDDPAGVGQLVLQIDFDDGFVAYLNGARVAAVNSPVDDPDFASIATEKHEPGKPERFDLTAHRGRLRRGENVLAIAGLNDRPSTDMTLIPELGSFPFIFHSSFELPAEGGGVYLSDAAGRRIDGVSFPPQAPDRSYGRSPDGSGGWAYFLIPSPGAPNRAAPFPRPPVVSLTASPPPGVHREALEVRLEGKSSVPGLEVRYTTDGAEPDAASALAVEGIPLARSAVLRAAGFIGRERATPPFSASYRIGPAPPLPVLSVSMDPGEFREVHLNVTARGRAAERSAFLEVIETGGREAVATGIGFRLHGGYGRHGDLSTKKSYRLYFRSCYGLSALGYPLIPGAPAAGLDKVVLRGGFNDRMAPNRGAASNGAAYLRDPVIRDLHRDMGALASRGTWALLHLNMEEKGLYDVVERLDEEFLISHLGGEEWDAVKTGNEVVSGSRKDWDELRRYALENDLSLAEHFQEIERRVDLENFTSYLILNLWAQNEDWPHNNWFAARPRRPDGRWIFLSWDAEFGLGLIPRGYQSQSFISFFSRPGPIRDLLGALLGNAGYRAYFRKEAERHLEGALRPENVERHIARHRDLIAPVMRDEVRSFARGATYESWIRSVEALSLFAGRRGSFFRRLVERNLVPAVPADPAADRPESYGGGRGSRGGIAFRGEGGRLESLTRDPAGGAWRRDSLADAGAPRAAGRPSAFAPPGGKTRHVAYRGEDGSLHELSVETDGSGRDRAGSRRWKDLTASASAPAPAGDPDACFWEGDASPHIVYRGHGGQIHELWLEGTWRHQSPSLAAGAPRIAGEPAIHVSPSDRTLRIVYRGEDQGIHELWAEAGKLPPGRPRGWRHLNLARTAGGVRSGGNPDGWASPTGGERHIVYRGADGHVQELTFDGGWRSESISDSLGAPAAAGDPRYREGGVSRRILYRGADGHIHELSFDGAWGHQDLTAAAGAPDAAGDPEDVGEGEAWSVAYPAAGGRLHHLSFRGRWRHEDLGAGTAEADE